MTDRIAGKHNTRESHEPRLLAHLFVDLSISESLPEWDGTHGLTEWGMDGNDQYGDCGPAAADHNNVAKANSPALIDTLGNPTYAGAVATYFAYGEAMGQGPNSDQGVENVSFLGWLYKQGIIKGYGEVPKALAFAFAQKFGGAIVAQSLSDNAQSQFESIPPIPWGQPTDVPNPNEGHDTLLIITHADGSGSMVTWAKVQPFTPAYFDRFVTDVWVIFDPDDPAVNWPALQAALDSIHGVVTPPPPAPPVVPPPPPVTPPAPPAPPSPSPDLWQEIVNAFENFLAELKRLTGL